MKGQRVSRGGALRVLSDRLMASLFAALLLALVEIASLHEVSPGLALTSLGLLLGLGTAVGVVWIACEWLVERASLPLVVAAALRALAAVPALIFVGATLFDGSRAATLPGARWGHVWVPALGFALLWAVFWAGGALLAGRKRALRLGIAAALVAVAAVLETANRQVLRSEYADIHAFLVAAVLVLIAVAMTLALRDGEPPAGRAWLWARGAAASLGVVALSTSIVFGLESRDSRWAVATSGTATRHLARLWRVAFDRDGDGFSRALGGGDCNDEDGAIHPAAAEIAQNGVDEDCDGADAAPVAVDVDRAAAERAWQTSEPRRRLVEASRGHNVLMISIDTLRSDVIRELGPERVPHLSALANDSLRFAHAFSPSAGTDLSVSTVITGRVNPFQVIERTLVEALAASGRHVEAILPSEVLRYAGRTLLTRGVDRLRTIVTDKVQRDVGDRTTSAETTDRALRSLQADEPFLVWVHYFDIHEHLQIDGDDPVLADIAPGATGADKYRALVQVVDGEIGRLMRHLEEQGLADRTVVVLFSDHGESLQEDPRLPEKHGRFAYNALVHVPLYLRIPGVTPQTVDAAVSLIDIPATLADLFELEIEGLAGRSLLPFATADSPAVLREEPWPIVINESEQWSLILWPDKLLWRPAENLVELYDLERDFAEQRDRSQAEPDRVAELKALYQSYPTVDMDRTTAARRRREQLARPPETTTSSE